MKPTLAETAGTTGSMASGVGVNAAPVASGCVRWCMNVALQSFAGEPWAVQLRPLPDGAAENSLPTSSRCHPHPNGSLTLLHGKTTTQATAFEHNRANTASSHNANTNSNGDSGSVGAASSVTSSLPSANASSTSVREGLRSHESLVEPRRRASDTAEGIAVPAAMAVTFGEGFGTAPAVEGSLTGLEHVTAAERCGVQLCAVDYDDLHESSDGSECATGSPNHPLPMPNDELEALRECVQAVNDPPVTYGSDELLSRIVNVEFIPSETPTPEGLLQYCLHSSLEPVLHATLQPAVTAVVDHCVSSMVLVYGATQEMKQMGLIGTPEECGLLPHGIRMFMDRYTERKEHQQQSAVSGAALGGGSGSASGTHAHPQGTEGAANRSGIPGTGGPSTAAAGAGAASSTGSSGGAGANFVFPGIGSSTHRFTRIEASFIAFDAVNVVDLLDLSNRHIELVLRLAPPPTPSEFEDTGIDGGSGRLHRPTTDSFVLNARVTPAESTNDALSALDVGLENLARALEAAMFQSESGSSLLFSLTAYTDSCRCATFHVLCLAEDPAAQTWLASTILARSQAIPLGEEQSWASIQNTPMPPPLHHHAATILVPALCFGNMFTSVLICVYNSITALGRLNRDLTLAVTGYRMRTIPRVTSATTRRGTKKLPPGWEEHFTEDGRRYFTDTNTQLSTWADPRLTPGYQQPNHRGSKSGGGSSSGQNNSAHSNAGDSAGSGTHGANGTAAKGSSGDAASGDAASAGASGGGAACVRTEGSSTYAANAAPQPLRRGRVGLGQGDHNFLTRAIQQSTETSSTTMIGGSTGTASGREGGPVSGSGLVGEEGIPSVDVGIVVIDTECRPRVVLNSQNSDFTAQFTREQETLRQEKVRRTQLQHQQHAQGASGAGHTTGTPAQSNAGATQDNGPKAPCDGNRAMDPRETSSVNPTGDTTLSSSTTAVRGGQGHPNGPSSNTTIGSTAGDTGSESAVAPSSLRELPRTRTEDNVRTAPAAAGGTAPAPLSVSAARHATTEVEMETGDRADNEANLFTPVAPAEADRPPLDPRRLALNPDVDDDDDDDDEDILALSRSDATSIEDFVFDDDSDDEVFASATYTPEGDASGDTRRFYQNAMQEQMTMPLEEARGTSVVGTPLGTPSPANGSGSTSNPGSPGSGTTPASVAISPDMQDLESLVEEFSKFFAQAYQAEEEVKRLQEEVKRLKRYVHHLRRAQQPQADRQTPLRPPQQYPHQRPSKSIPHPTAPAASGLTAPSSVPAPKTSSEWLMDGSDNDSPISDLRRSRLQRRLCGGDRAGSGAAPGAPAATTTLTSVAAATPPSHTQNAFSDTLDVASSHLLYAPLLLADAQNLILLRTNETMRSRLEPALTSLAARLAASTTPLMTDAEGTMTETSSASRPTRSPVSHLTSPAVASVRSFAGATPSSGGGGDQAVLLSLLEAVLKEWQSSELRQGRPAGRN